MTPTTKNASSSTNVFFRSINYRILGSLVGFLSFRRITQILSHKRKHATLNSSDFDKRKKQLLIDVSTIIKNDSRTGIQRAVRSIIKQFNQNPPNDYDIRPIYATKTSAFMYAPEKFYECDSLEAERNDTEVKCSCGDIFFGLDLNTKYLPMYIVQLIQWQLKGVSINILVYDMLPILNPGWFEKETAKRFKKWMLLSTLVADKLIFISKTVKDEYSTWFFQNSRSVTRLPELATIRLGADIEESAPTFGIPQEIDFFLAQIKGCRKILVVGTLEPRKGQLEVLQAFDELWSEDNAEVLIFVGRKGWQTSLLQETIILHPLLNNKLFWFENASDEFLCILYKLCDGVIVNSKGEGLGLPLIEALHHQKPVLVRDIPVFREVAYKEACFFENLENRPTSAEVKQWINCLSEYSTTEYIYQTTWATCAVDVSLALGLLNDKAF